MILYIAFFQQGDLKYFIIPLTFVSAYRFGMRITTSLIMVIVIFSTIATSLGYGPLLRRNIIDSILLLDLFLSITVICSLFSIVVLSERQRAEDLIKKSELNFRKNQDIQ